MIMSQTDDIHESFYDLFNQHFRRIDDPEVGPRYFTNIAIGAHTKPSRVHENFQCIVVIKESEIKNTPAPFLNRFEKYYISHKNLLDLVLKTLPPWVKMIVDSACKKVSWYVHSCLHRDCLLYRLMTFILYLMEVHSMVLLMKQFALFFLVFFLDQDTNTRKHQNLHL